MRIKAEHIDELSNYLDARQQEGRYLFGYDVQSELFEKSAVRTFDNEFDALMVSYEMSLDQPTFKILPLEPIVEAVKIINDKMALSPLTKENRSFDFNMEQIINDHFYNKELNKETMEIDNVKIEELSTVAKTLKYSGMGKISNEELNQKIAEGSDTFKVGFVQEFKEASAEAVIQCARSKKGMYYADSYDIIVREEGKPDLERNYKFRGPVPVKSQQEDGKKEMINPTISFKEAFNQMQGRGVYKTFVFVDAKEPENNRKYDAWEYIDFSKTDTQGNYKTEKFYDLDVEKKVKSLSLVENMDYENFQRLCESLKRGNVQSAKYIALDGTQEKIYLVANGRFDTINAFDKDMNPISLQEKRQLELDTLEHYKQNNRQKQEVKPEDEVSTKKTRGKKIKA